MGDTAIWPDAGPTVGSRVTFLVRDAASGLRKGVLTTASALLGRPVGELEFRDGYVRTGGGPEGRVALSEIARVRNEAKLANTFEGHFGADVAPASPDSRPVTDAVGRRFAGIAAHLGPACCPA